MLQSFRRLNVFLSSILIILSKLPTWSSFDEKYEKYEFNRLFLFSRVSSSKCIKFIVAVLTRFGPIIAVTKLLESSNMEISVYRAC